MIVGADAMHIPLGDKSVHCVVTSPPYWGLRSYGFKSNDPARKRMIGLEPTFDRHLWNLVRVFREVRRVLRDDGTVWLNYGDSYSHDTESGPQGANGQRADRRFTANVPAKRMLPAKNLIGMAWRVAFALQNDGWILRNDIVRHKRSPMPEPVTDRCTKAHEHVFLFSKSLRYFYDPIGGREQTGREASWNKWADGDFRAQSSGGVDSGFSGACRAKRDSFVHPLGRNMRDVWTLSTEPYHYAHFATFPTELVARCLRPATSSKGCCPTCGAQWRRVTERERRATRPGTGSKVPVPSGWAVGEGDHSVLGYSIKRETGETIQRCYKPWAAAEVGNRDPLRHVTDFKTVGWRPTCDHGGEPARCRVLDPFAGSGTVGVTCRRMGLDFIGLELSEDYCRIARARISAAMDDRPVSSKLELQSLKTGLLDFAL